MKLKHLFALMSPLVFLFLAACDFSGIVTGTFDVPCPMLLPIVNDTTATGTFNAACPFRIWDGDSLITIIPGLLKT